MNEGQPQQYTHYSESVYMARNPSNAQPTDSMLLDSMMNSSILNVALNTTTNHNSGSHHRTEFTIDPLGSSLVESNLSISNLGGSDSSLNDSTSSSIYYDAAGTASYMVSSVIEGAFEPSPNDR